MKSSSICRWHRSANSRWKKIRLRPDMSSDEIERIIREAYSKVPYAVGLNNHMGSAMTSSLFGMLEGDAGAGTLQPLFPRQHDHRQQPGDARRSGNRREGDQAQGVPGRYAERGRYSQCSSIAPSQLARRNGSAIAIGHPHPSTVRVLQQMVYNLPPDITLVRPSSLLNEPQVDNSTPNTLTATHNSHSSRSRVIRSAA